MTQNVSQRLNLFIQNYEKLKNAFRWEQSAVLTLSAILITNEDKVAQIDQIEYYKNLIKQRTPIFSVFRGNIKFTFASILSISDDPQTLLKNSLEVYDLMKREGFTSSDYLAVSAINIARSCEHSDYPYTIGRTRQFYDAMKKHHRFVTSSDDYCFAAMLAMTDLNVNSSIKEIESMFSSLKPMFSSSNGLQSLTHVLAIGPDATDQKLEKTIQVYRAFRDASFNFNDTSTMSSLGVAVLLCDDIHTLVSEVGEVAEEIHKIRGFGNFTYTNKQRGLLAFSIVTSAYANKLSNSVISTTLTNSITNILIAQQTSMMIAATVAASAAASTSN